MAMIGKNSSWGKTEIESGGFPLPHAGNRPVYGYFPNYKFHSYSSVPKLVGLGKGDILPRASLEKKSLNNITRKFALFCELFMSRFISGLFMQMLNF